MVSFVLRLAMSSLLPGIVSSRVRERRGPNVVLHSSNLDALVINTQLYRVLIELQHPLFLDEGNGSCKHAYARSIAYINLIYLVNIFARLGISSGTLLGILAGILECGAA